jgi:Cysteine-rich CPXCG
MRSPSWPAIIARTMTGVTYSCAFCGEDNDVFVDPSGGRRQTFTEDCAVCCRPNLITLTIEGDGEVLLEAAQEYEA